MGAEQANQMELFTAGNTALAVQAVPQLPYPAREERLVMADALARRISRHAGVPVRLAVTDNRSTMVSYQRAGARARAAAAPHVPRRARQRGARRWRTTRASGQPGAAGRVIDDYIDGASGRIRRAAAPASSSGAGAVLRPAGHLRRLNRSTSRAAFARASAGRAAPTGRRRKTIRLGVYEHQTREIRIHPRSIAPTCRASSSSTSSSTRCCTSCSPTHTTPRRSGSREGVPEVRRGDRLGEAAPQAPVRR